ncbi:tRNA uridine-5-carboxymethylaminomethyl(34) synthesis enzyme MnmG [candidate division GN15 bacterium]|nr:tRNA uridine-5-carboxymethylaminomethyl(34) synthesis enzyme MnmG [candidate division GN15 bacterium]
MKHRDFDIIVVGGGHAGVETALVGERMGRSVALVTMDRKKLALMSCNPAIGGIAKSHVVKEVDALGGVMGLAADAAGIQFRRLNLSRGPAVWSTRVQCDRRRYAEYIVDYVSERPRITVIEGIAGRLIVASGAVAGIVTEDGREISGGAVVIATGTFLGGVIHVGQKQIRAGRMGEPAATQMSRCLQELGFETGRLKTGTPPRLDGQTIDWEKCRLQPGDDPLPLFSEYSRREPFAQIPCHLTYTTDQTKQIVSQSFDQSPMFSGQIQSTGPRYCPSIEDKFHRFAEKPSHQIFLEPEGNGTSEVYPNGFSTALPEEIQRQAVRTIVGLEEVKMTRPGYAIEYDYCPARQVKASLETKLVSGLYFVGQINGTSGYEEAAGQGLMAGLNACLQLEGELPLILDRSEAYIGVMIDDLVTRSTTEPYRLFTSRAEYRLALREDNARDRLWMYARRYGLLPEDVLTGFDQLRNRTDRAVTTLERRYVEVASLDGLATRFKRRTHVSLADLLRQPGVSIADCREVIGNSAPELADDEEALGRAAIQIQYSGYIEKQQREIDKFRRAESHLIPEDFDFSGVRGLKTEAREKLARFRPRSLGQAGRIEGVTPGDVAVLSVWVKRHEANGQAGTDSSGERKEV